MADWQAQTRNSYRGRKAKELTWKKDKAAYEYWSKNINQRDITEVF